VIAVAGRRRPPLRDPRWCALQAAVEAMQRKTGKMSLAITDLEEAMADGKRPLPTMRRNLSTGARERLASTFWTEHLIDFSTGAVAIYRRRKGEPRRFGMFAHHNEDRVDGAAYFVWGPDLDKLLGAAPVADDSPPPVPVKPSPKKKRQRKKGGGRRHTFTPEQQTSLQERYREDLKADPLLAKRDAAVAHVKGLAKTAFGIDAGRNTLLAQIIRPVLPGNQK
jgi:hypothetical protein